MKPEVSEIKEDFVLSDVNFLDIINEFALALLDQSTVDEVVKTVIDKAIDKLGFVDCVIYLWKVKDEILFQSAANGAKLTDDGEINNAILIKYGQGIVGSVAKSQKPRIVNDTSLDPNYIIDDAERLSEIAVPIIHNGNLLGVIDSEHPERNFYTDYHLKILTTVASMTSMKLVQAYNMEALKKRQKRLDQIYNSTNDLMFLVAVEENESYRYISVNKTYEGLLDMKHTRLEGKTIKEVWKKDVAERIRSRFKESIKSKQSLSYEVETETNKGRVVVQSKISPIFNENGVCVQIAGVARDVTSLKEREEDLKESRDLFENLFESSPDAIYIHDFKKITNVNRRFLDQFRYESKEDIIGKPPLESTVSSRHIQKILDTRKDLQVNGTAFLPKIELLRNDGSMFISESRISMIHIQGKPHVQIITRDITERTATEEATQKVKDRLLVASQITKMGTFEWYPRISEPFWDEQLDKMFQIPKGFNGSKNLHFVNILHKDDQEWIVNEFARRMSSKCEENEFQDQFRIKCKNGAVKVFASNVLMFRNKYGRPYRIVGACTDITDTRKAENEKSKLLKAVQRNEDKFRSLFENAPYPILLINKQHKFVDCNKAAVEIFEAAGKNEIIGQNSWAFSPDKQSTGALSSEYSQEMNKMAYRLGQHEYEWVDKRKDGTERFIHVSLTRINIDLKELLLVHFQDMTQRVQAIKALRRSKERLRQIIDLVPHFIFAKDEEGRFILVNKAVAEAYGSTVKGLINKTDADFNDNLEEVEFFRQKDLEVIRGNKSQFNIEEVITNDKGEQRTLSTTKIPFSDSGDNRPAVLGVSVDITEEIKKQEKLEELLRVTSDQNERLQNFAHIISHNIRSHSSNISSLVNFVDKTDKVQEQKILLGMLKTSTEKLEETIVNLNEIIDVNKKLQKPSERRNLNREISNTLEILNTKIIGCEANVSLNVPMEITVKVIPAYLDSILLNIITNAIKYRSEERALELTVNVEKQDNWVVLEVRDNGLGIDLERHGDKIFGMYKTFHTNEDSRGFGLFITKNQIEAMGGKIEVISEVNKGSTFKVYFYEEN